MIQTIKVGDSVKYTRSISFEEIKQFATLSHDENPAHLDSEYAKTTRFKSPIVHGMFIGSLFSKIFGMEFPGEGTIYCSQSLTFLRPVYPDTLLTVKVTVKEVIPLKNRVIFTTEIFDDQENCLLTGEAMLMPKKEDSSEKKHG